MRGRTINLYHPGAHDAMRHRESLRELELSGARQQQAAFAQEQQNRQRLYDLFLGSGSGEGGEFGGPGFADGPLGMGGYRERANAIVDQMGNADRMRIERGFDAREQESLANLSDRGLGGSSSAANISLGTERERQEALTNLEDAQAGRRLGVEQDLFQQQARLVQQLLGGIFSY